ncbi:hypothetical protein A2Z22_03420 [Candidatus Woesebacteria bacterium RBG_16_34_12]|uniref:Uncharacterized protein n=1 Tax=Candidatus Woesebacteria bacterium RBG_16_34_12 TaxID=1802480 RepID=A0A1F7XAX5_9BACT|nr:MAG: hypothetical protein A2Z22_03420 [Candidatus Woesebacteria bacterium RBG_16_34_12]
MKKQFYIHFSFLIAYFLIITLIRRWFSLKDIGFWLGGLIGTLLPYSDHFIYVYFLRPIEPMSLEVRSLVGGKNLRRAFELLITTRRERQKMIFHTVYFQIIFLVLTFFVITSSGSIFGRGLVLAFALHLLIDQIIDWMETKNLDNWFLNLPISLDKEQKQLYLLGNIFLLLLFGLYF